MLQIGEIETMREPVRARVLGLNDTTMSVDDSLIDDQNKHDCTPKHDSTSEKTTRTTLDNNSMLEKISLLLDKKLEENKISFYTKRDKNRNRMCVYRVH